MNSLHPRGRRVHRSGPDDDHGPPACLARSIMPSQHAFCQRRLPGEQAEGAGLRPTVSNPLMAGRTADIERFRLIAFGAPTDLIGVAGPGAATRAPVGANRARVHRAARRRHRMDEAKPSQRPTLTVAGAGTAATRARPRFPIRGYRRSAIR